MKNHWREKFKEEFGIHFEDLSGELGFAIEFIKEEKELSYKQGLNKRLEYDKNGWKELVEEEKEKYKEEIKKMIEEQYWSLQTDPQHSHDGSRKPRVAVIDKVKLLKKLENL